jgi:hypothetical protein
MKQFLAASFLLLMMISFAEGADEATSSLSTPVQSQTWELEAEDDLILVEPAIGTGSRNWIGAIDGVEGALTILAFGDDEPITGGHMYSTRVNLPVGRNVQLFFQVGVGEVELNREVPTVVNDVWIDPIDPIVPVFDPGDTVVLKPMLSLADGNSLTEDADLQMLGTGMGVPLGRRGPVDFSCTVHGGWMTVDGSADPNDGIYGALGLKGEWTPLPMSSIFAELSGGWTAAGNAGEFAAISFGVGFGF